MWCLKKLILLLVAVLPLIAAQRCPGSPSRPACGPGLPNGGHGGRGCTQRAMWYYNSRTHRCMQLRYLGCGGSNNRFCTRDQCRRTCRAN